MTAVIQPHTPDLTVANAASEATMSLLGDTFAIHEVGERIAYSEVLPHLVMLGESGSRERVTLLVSAREVTEKFGLAERPEDDDSLVALLPTLESALDILREILSGEEFGWSRCRFSAGLLERDGMKPVEDGELRILISPAGGIFASPGSSLTLPSGTKHAVSRSLAPDGCPASDAEVAPILVQRSRSRDLLATCGLISFLRRNPSVIRDLTLDTIRQVEFEFPRFVEEGVLAL